MDAHVLKHLATELNFLLSKAKITKVYASGQLFAFKLTKPPCPAQANSGLYPTSLETQKFLPYLNLALWPLEALFLSEVKPLEALTPSATTMRLRKYLNARSIQRVFFSWAKKAVVIELETSSLLPKGIEPACGVLLDWRKGPELIFESTLLAKLDDCPAKANWNIDATLEIMANQRPEELLPPDARNKFPYLTPLLRKTLPHLEMAEQKALLIDLEQGAGDIFVYLSNQQEAQEVKLISAWPLPQALCEGLTEKVFSSAQAAQLACLRDQVYCNTVHRLHKEELQTQSNEKKRLLRLLQKLNEEELRLTKMLQRKEEALLLQNNLYQWTQGEKLTQVTVSVTKLAGANKEIEQNFAGYPEPPPHNQTQAPMPVLTEGADLTDELVQINLDSLLTVRENMNLLFKQAQKGQRGLAHLARRREEVAARLAELEQTNLNSLSNPEFACLQPQPCQKSVEQGKPKNPRPANASTTANPLISQFTSPSGLTLLRGRSAKGNAQVLKLASSFDYWLHSEGGPSAHLIIKLPYAAFVVPEEDLLYAARLVAEKSWQRNDLKASVMCALAKNVKPVKGGPTGAVHVGELLRTVMVKQN